MTLGSDPVVGPPRLAPLRQAEWDEFLARLVEASGGPDHALNIFTTLGRHPELFRRWVSFGGTLLGGTLPGRERELAILRTAVWCGADYEWSHHAGTARSLGVGDEELSGLRQPLDAHAWSAPDLALLSAVDEMHDTWALSDEAWAPLHERFGDAGVIELVMLVGQYHLVALALRVLRVQEEGA